MADKCELFYREAEKVEEESTSESLDDSRKQVLCSKLEQLVTKLDSSHAAIIETVKSGFATVYLTNLGQHKNYYQNLLKQYQQTAESGKQTSLVSSASVGDKDPNEIVIDTRNGALENAEENVEVFSSHSATQGSRKQPSIANSRSLTRRKVEEIELEDLRAKKETEQQLQELQLEIEQERVEIELCRQQEELRLQQLQQQREQELQQQQPELRLKMQQQKDKLSLPRH